MKKCLTVLFALHAIVFAQENLSSGGDLPRIAVYVTGDVPENDKKALGTRMLATLVNSGRYRGIERSNSFLAEIDKEQTTQRSGAIDDSQISKLGKQFGVKFVCIADITPSLGAYQVSARIVDVETAEVVFIGESYSMLRTIVDLVKVCDQVVKNMFGGQTTLAREHNPTPKSEPVPEPEPVPAPPEPEFVAAPEPEPVTLEPEPAVSELEPVAPEPSPAAPEPEVALNQANTEPAKPEPESKPEPEPKPKYKPEIKLSAGAGGFFASDFGGGIRWSSGRQVAMPYYGGGAYLFFDAIYAEIFAGYSIGNGKWESADAADKNDLPNMRRTYANGGLFVKYPVGAGGVRGFPLLGVDYEYSTAAKLIYVDGNEYVFDGKSKRSTAKSLSAMWVRFGGGLDMDLGSGVYLRTELLYGLRAASTFEKDCVVLYDKEINSSHDAQPKQGSGLTVKIGAGVKF